MLVGGGSFQYDIVNSSPPGQNDRHCADNVLKCISWMKIYELWFTEICSQGPNLQETCIGPDNALAPNRRQAIIWTNADPIHWRIYAALGGYGLIPVIIRSVSAKTPQHWNGNAVILTKFSSLATLEVVILTTSSAPGMEISSKWQYFRFGEYTTHAHVARSTR